MTRRELIADVNRQCRFSNKDGVEYILKLLEKSIIDALIQGKTINLNGFMKLGTKEAKPRKGTLKGKKWKTDKKIMAYAKISPVIQKKIQEHKDMDWLDIFASYPDEVQYEFVKEAQRQLGLGK